MKKEEISRKIESENTLLGIEFGPTRIKAVLIGEDHAPLASGSIEWRTGSRTAR